MFLLLRVRFLLRIKLRKDPARRLHVKRMMKVALKLQKHYGADKKQTKIAVLLHDILKNEDPKTLKKMVEEHFPALDHQAFPEATWHALCAMIYAKEKLGISDSDVLNAIKYHTTGRVGMSLLEKIICLADYIEEGRTYVSEDIKSLAYLDIDKALYLSMLEITAYLRKHNLPVSSLTLAAIGAYTSQYGGI